MSYSRLPESQGPRRDFRITVGLREGWGADGRLHSVDEAAEVSLAWMERRAAEARPFLSGMLTPGNVAYAWTDPQGVARRGDEPVVLFTGDALHAHVGQLTDSEIEALLDELAALLGAALGQEHLHIAFGDRMWTLARRD